MSHTSEHADPTADRVTPGLKLTVLRSVSELEAIRSVWKAWSRHPNADFDLYNLLLTSRPEILRPHVILVHRNGAPDSILIGRLEQRHVALKIGYKTILRPNVRLLAFIHQGYLGQPSPENSDLLLNEILTSLGQGEADIAFFNSLSVDSSLYRSAT